MARIPKPSETVRKAAEAAMPGWEIDSAPPVETAAIKADFAGKDSIALKRKYLNEPDAAETGADSAGTDAEFIAMKPLGPSPVARRKVIVSGGTVIGVQG